MRFNVSHIKIESCSSAYDISIHLPCNCNESSVAQPTFTWLHIVVKYYHIFLEQLYSIYYFVMYACILFIPIISVDTHFIIRTFHIVTTAHFVLYHLGRSI